MTEQVSDRLVDQRIRNRIIDALEMLAECKGGEIWDGLNYIDAFFDWMGPDDLPRPNSAITTEELHAITGLAELMSGIEGQREAWVAVEHIVASRASEVLALLLIRGRFDDEIEQANLS